MPKPPPRSISASARRRPVALSFGCCVDKVAELIERREIHVLIVEAPLSGLFGANGDPAWRRPFEQQAKDTGFSRRYWYTQPASTVCLAAAVFFQRLGTLIKSYRGSIEVYEGFVSFKSRKTRRCEDALRLLAAAGSTEMGEYYEVRPEPGQHLLSFLYVAGVASHRVSAPAVIACS